MSARRTRRSGGTGRSGGGKCAWCEHMGAAVDACTWKPRGRQSEFVMGAGVSGACLALGGAWKGEAFVQIFNVLVLRIVSSLITTTPARLQLTPLLFSE